MTYTVGFLGRGRLGLRVLEGLLAYPNVHVPVIVCCGATPEVEDVSERMRTLAAERGIDFFATDRMAMPEWAERLASYRLHLAVALLWLHTIDAPVIATARDGFLNFHGGHLPKYRGNACANWAILNGEPHIGATVHLMAPGSLDSGPIVLQEFVPLGPESTIGEVTAEMEERGVRLVLAAVEAFRTGTAAPVPQDESQASYCYPRLPRDGEIDWHSDAAAIDRLVRVSGRPYPGAYSWFSDHRSGAVLKLTIWRAHVEPHPLSEFHAVPGHVLRLDSRTRTAIVCGDKKLLILDEIEIDGARVEPATAFRTVRQRLGLDLSLLAARWNT
jgi:methionyl-tRNA formyltransferase